VHSVLWIGEADGKDDRSAHRADADICARPLKEQQRRALTARIADSTERPELFGVSRMRRGREQQHARGSCGNGVHGGAAGCAERRAMCFVHNHDVPVNAFERLKDLRTLDEIE
jgi:hypothetical protein